MADRKQNKDFVPKDLDWNEGGGVGINPDYMPKTEGKDPHFKTRQYDKNYARMQGTCLNCENFDVTAEGAQAQHCTLRETENCTK